MTNTDNFLSKIRTSILVKISLFSFLVFLVLLLITIKIDFFFGLVLMTIHVLILLFYTIPAYLKRVKISREFSREFYMITDSMSKALNRISSLNNMGKIQFNIFSFDSQIGFSVVSSLGDSKEIDEQCLTISKLIRGLLKKYGQTNEKIYVNLDALLVGLVALWLIDNNDQFAEGSLKLYTRGYDEYFKYNGGENDIVIKRIKYSLIKQAL